MIRSTGCCLLHAFWSEEFTGRQLGRLGRHLWALVSDAAAGFEGHCQVWIKEGLSLLGANEALGMQTVRASWAGHLLGALGEA